MKLRLLSLLLCLVSLAACSSPESDAEKAAQAYFDAYAERSAFISDNYEAFIRDFNPANFTSRAEARAAAQKIIDDANARYEEAEKQAQVQLLKLQNKYAKKPADKLAFQNAFTNYISTLGAGEEEINSIPLEIEKLIATIIPPTPSAEKMKTDLVGRNWQDTEDGYFGTKPKEIEDGYIQSVEILSDSAKSNEYNANILFMLQENPGAVVLKINADIRYLLGPDGDDWKVDYLAVNSVDVVRTGKYEKYITSQIRREFESELVIKNNLDARLIVGGRFLMQNDPKWHNFSVILEPNGSKTIGGLFFGNVEDYEIHFVERR